MAGVVDFVKVLVDGPEGPRQALASIFPLDDTGAWTGSWAGTDMQSFTFPFFPDSITDQVAINYSDIEVLGLSHQLVQWTGNGGRTLSFDAMLSRDIRVQEELPRENRLVDPLAPNNREMNYDVRYSIAKLRSFCYPSKSDAKGGDVTFSKPPPILALTLDGMALGKGGGDTVFVVMTSCNVEYGRLFASGIPRRAKVSLEFKEVIQKGGAADPWWASDFEAAIDKFSPLGELLARNSRTLSVRAKSLKAV
ncbi:hypothetical protein UFOVP1382_136 [uncultured Caudovirales phage]|uniref:Uncharacterized protein n=1 Tax=uncultured Caudovirales phage TaxID=2100421 RepID=A0A6J5RXW1_9CAUD|nr:hypothetical protein UFOVP1382_136 [uncultured Caudovirales phage]